MFSAGTAPLWCCLTGGPQQDQDGCRRGDGYWLSALSAAAVEEQRNAGEMAALQLLTWLNWSTCANLLGLPVISPSPFQKPVVMWGTAGKLNAFANWTCYHEVFFVVFLPGCGRSLLGLSGTCHVVSAMLVCKTWRVLPYLEEQIPFPIPFLMPPTGSEDHSPTKLAAGQVLPWQEGSVASVPSVSHKAWTA